MLDGLKDKAKELMASPGAAVLGHPAVQGVLRKAMTFRADLADQLDDRLSGVAKKLKLATSKEVKALRRQIRELENQVAVLDGQLKDQRTRGDRAEAAFSDAQKAAKKAAQALEAAEADNAKALAEVAALKAELEQAKAEDDKGGDKPTTKKTARAKKKAESELELPTAPEGE